MHSTRLKPGLWDSVNLLVSLVGVMPPETSEFVIQSSSRVGSHSRSVAWQVRAASSLMTGLYSRKVTASYQLVTVQTNVDAIALVDSVTNIFSNVATYLLYWYPIQVSQCHKKRWSTPMEYRFTWHKRFCPRWDSKILYKWMPSDPAYSHELDGVEFFEQSKQPPILDVGLSALLRNFDSQSIMNGLLMPFGGDRPRRSRSWCMVVTS
ncbi:hypothetical protein SCLCIDRAFT_623040 [Scleroderma citrinum Foug A]|uniref:Uncharacterized protein n=1 Tax=Scleroderma citrinum Foug A TaxID=1036808 RepID=A0A0C3CSQ2_9AGAM|nr:hypothetical protein SCLCIDRAFT_623040 [Scleroderma citrinum Foug A]